MPDRTEANPPGYVPPVGRDPADPLPPGLIDGKRYTLLRKLGGGGMGVVYLVQNVRMGRPEVVKLIAPDQSASPTVIDRFRQEIVALGQLNHPHVAAGYGTDEIDGTLVLMLEYVDGTDLSELVKANGPLPIGRACEYIRQAALGLQHAHDKGLVHRDVKPHNLLLRREREQEWVKVIDFGLVKAPTLAHLRTDRTHAHQVLGTPAYMAPEQWAGAAAVGPPADIYALGCTLHHLLAGRPPFDPTMGRTKLMLAHADDPPPPLAGLPPGLENVLNRLLAKAPADRPASASEVAALLAPFTGIPDRLGAAPTLVAEAETVSHDPRQPDTHTEPASAPPPRSGSKRAIGIIGGGLACVAGAVAVLLTLAGGNSSAPRPTSPAPPPPKQPAVTRFGPKDTDGWVITNPMGASRDVVGLTRLEADGDRWRMVGSRGNLRGTFFWLAPGKFNGDQSDKFGKWLAYAARAKAAPPKELLDYQFVTLRTAQNPQAVTLFVRGRDVQSAELPGGRRAFAVRLDAAAGWRVRTNTGNPAQPFDGPPATDEQMKTVLAGLGLLLIRGEYSTTDKDGAIDRIEFGLDAPPSNW